MFPIETKIFIEGWLWAIFASFGVDPDRAQVLAKETGTSIKPLQHRMRASPVDSLFDTCSRGILNLERIVCCTKEPVQSTPFVTLHSLLNSLKQGEMQVFIHENETVDIVVLAGSIFLILSIHEATKLASPQRFASKEAAYSAMNAKSKNAWVYVCSIRV